MSWEKRILDYEISCDPQSQDNIQKLKTDNLLIWNKQVTRESFSQCQLFSIIILQGCTNFWKISTNDNHLGTPYIQQMDTHISVLNSSPYFDNTLLTLYILCQKLLYPHLVQLVPTLRTFSLFSLISLYAQKNRAATPGFIFI